jgi:hypothetical protein
MSSVVPDAPGPIDLSPQLASILGAALEQRHPIAVTYVDPEGKPHLSLRGTVQVLSSNQLAMWCRSSGLPDAIATNPNVALLYQNLENLEFYMFTGRARVDDDEAVRQQVFGGSPTREQAMDPDRKGTAVVVDIDSVTGRGPAGRVNMQR